VKAHVRICRGRRPRGRLLPRSGQTSVPSNLGFAALVCHDERYILSCCIKDEGRPLGLGDQALGSNHLMRLPLRVVVVSDKGSHID